MPFGAQIQNFYKAKCPLGPKFRISIRQNPLWSSQRAIFLMEILNFPNSESEFLNLIFFVLTPHPLGLGWRWGLGATYP